MKYTILSARFSNPQHDAAIVMTEEVGAVALSMVDTPDLWPAITALNPAPFAPLPAAPRQISRKAWNDAVAAAGKIEAWFACKDDVSLGALARLYFDTGGESGNYLESNAKLARLAAHAGIDVKAIFDASYT